MAKAGSIASFHSEARGRLKKLRLDELPARQRLVVTYATSRAALEEVGDLVEISAENQRVVPAPGPSRLRGMLEDDVEQA